VPDEFCAERARLSQPIVDAVAESCRAKEAYDSAKRNRLGKLVALSNALYESREAEREAERAFQGHVEQHGCQV
jgi:hypothetical protein